MGDIGKKKRTIELVPMPADVPVAEPSPEPALVPEPAKPALVPA